MYIIEECLPLHVAERDNTWMAGIEYLFSQDNGEENKLQTAENGSNNWGRTWIYVILYSELDGGNTSWEKKGGGLR